MISSTGNDNVHGRLAGLKARRELIDRAIEILSTLVPYRKKREKIVSQIALYDKPVHAFDPVSCRRGWRSRGTC
jgi:hypothetical protein